MSRGPRSRSSGRAEIATPAEPVAETGEHPSAAPAPDATRHVVHEPNAPLDPIFPRLMSEGESSENKLIGFVAYGFYEEAKREWATEFYIREGRYPADELSAYERSWTASRIEGLRNSAVQLVAAYADTVASHVEKDVLRRELKGRFLRFLGYWLMSAIIFAAAAAAGIVVLNRTGLDPLGFVRDLARG